MQGAQIINTGRQIINKIIITIAKGIATAEKIRNPNQIGQVKKQIKHPITILAISPLDNSLQLTNVNNKIKISCLNINLKLNIKI